MVQAWQRICNIWMKLKRWVKKDKCCLNKTWTAGNIFHSKIYLHKRLLEVFCLKSIAYLLIAKQQNVLKAVQGCFQHVKLPRNLLTDLALGVMCTKKYLKLGSTNNDNNIQMKICRKGNDIKHYLESKRLKNVKWKKLSPSHSMNTISGGDSAGK